MSSISEDLLFKLLLCRFDLVTFFYLTFLWLYVESITRRIGISVILIHIIIHTAPTHSGCQVPASVALTLPGIMP